MLDRDTGRPRGFGFVTFADKRGMDEAIARLHDRELDGRVVSVTKAQPKVYNGGGDKNSSYKSGYDNGGGAKSGGYGGRGGGGGAGRDDCFKCGQPGHWARECPSGEGRLSSRSDRYSSGGGRDRYGGGGGGGRDRYGGGSGYGGGRYSERERDRDGDRGYDRYESNYGRYGDRDSGRGSDRYGSGGAARYEGKYRERTGPYDRPSGGGRSSAYDDRY